MKPRHIALGGLLLGAAWLSIFGDKSPAGDVVTAVTRSTATSAAEAPVRADSNPSREPVILAVRDRAELLGDGDTPAGTLFVSQNWTPPPPPPPPVVVAPPPKPTAPPLPFTYLGKKQENGKWEAYLARGGDTYVVREHSMIDSTYRAEAITPTTVTITYLPLKQVQKLAIGEAD
ncbi:hypothetical protein [Cupriavidus ulmosensis]|uniref:hypothetical protein n=1 Tax=Cupriavidus ulmosensis TaxID=3065913 RepID=UPI00296B35F4|nr:hypothetical protein [Cupriavidus sp. CV2]MDW3682861.1 hypothetical protein [Cupriavidus sp. CV2]